jgi:hypothetical protein
VFTARYAPSPYIKQIRFVCKGLKDGWFEGVLHRNLANSKGIIMDV